MTIQILGIQFFKGKVDEVFHFLKNKGGLLTVPAAPALVTVSSDTKYYSALLESDIVIPDSGYMVLVWNIFFKNKINKISGLEFINFFIANMEEVKEDAIFLVNPSDVDGKINKDFFNERGVKISDSAIYTAPFYNGNVNDNKLLELIESQKPKWIFINIGGGTQEKLGLFLKNNLSYSPAILCTGAALAFKTGRQANVPVWADYIYMGWLMRCLSNPKVFVPRYFSGFKLLPLILVNKSNKVAPNKNNS
ncbi:WecB/TagA/CpsF family glycosyltransferase [Flavobacterium sp.]|uniref:WecB/TagA/CpsF family glycosyltransferase n=1 Tax=Flavobacterium sp. TaxID=239 RepID=UPI002FDA6009